jgi:malonate decarboxylase beta subunit
MSTADVLLAEPQRFISRNSFIELSARERARVLLDSATFRELVGPFDRLHSPWLEMQNVVVQEDDGVVVARGAIDGRPAVVTAIEGAFQGGSMGEVGGQKIVCALDFALRDYEQGTPTLPVLVLETGGVRLQEANLGLAVIAEIHASIIALRRHVPVIAVISGTVGCFGGMSLAAALCSSIIMTREGRLGMNGPEVIEQEAGIEELDASDKRLIWSIIGGEQRYAVGLVDALVVDDVDEIVTAVRDAAQRGVPARHRTEEVDVFLERLDAVDPANIRDAASLRALWSAGQ